MLRLRVLIFSAALGFLFAAQAMASLDDVSYPIVELGGCASQDECFAYCNDSANFDACINFAEANNLLEEEEIAEYRTAEEALAENGGPGGCTDQVSCEAFCSDIANMEVCLSFARENGMMSEEELAKATQVLEAIQSGATLPGGCTNQDTCEAYCKEVDHMEECLNFASAAGIMTEEELEEAQTMMEKMQSGDMPGGCDSEETCSAYCMQEVNREECEAFFGEMGGGGEGSDGSERGERGASPEGTEEYDEEYQSSFVGPGGCTSEEACMSYCLDPANMDECASFFGPRPDTGDVFEEVIPSYDEGTEYEYEGGSYEQSYDEDHFDEPSGFEGLGPEDIPLDLEGEYDEDHLDSSATPYDEIEVTPETTESETASEIDASFIESIQKFLSGVVTKL